MLFSVGFSHLATAKKNKPKQKDSITEKMEKAGKKYAKEWYKVDPSEAEDLSDLKARNHYYDLLVKRKVLNVTGHLAMKLKKEWTIVSPEKMKQAIEFVAEDKSKETALLVKMAKDPKLKDEMRLLVHRLLVVKMKQLKAANKKVKPAKQKALLPSMFISLGRLR